MKAKKLFAAGIAALSVAQAAMAVPAYPGIIKAKQADGTEISIRLHGDEFSNYETTADGFPLFYNESTHNYEYAKAINGKIAGSGIIAADEGKRSAEAIEYITTADKEAITAIAMEQRHNLSTTANGIMRAASGPRRGLINNFPHFGEQHSIVILMQYNDKEFSTMEDPKQYYTDAMNKEGFTAINGANGSARDFFVDCSHGQFKPTFDVYGPVTIDYGCHDAGQGTYNTNINMGTFVKAAIEGLDNEIDFSQYDHDGDGVVDNIYIFYAGNGSNDSSDKRVVWPHAYDLRSWGINLKTNDGVTIGSYTCSNEVDGQRTGMTTGIGTFVHEFGHCLGFADHYNTESNGKQTYTPYNWDTMAHGSYNNNGNTPPRYSSYECYELGWLTPEEITCRTAGTNELPELGASNKAYRISVPGKPNEYYLLENRQQKGWDEYLPAAGMLVWHIDFDQSIWDENIVNNVSNHQRVDIVEANGKLTGETYYAAGVPFPGSAKVTTYDFASWAGEDLISIDNIAMQDSVVSFIVKGANSGIAKPKLNISNLKYNGFHGSWDKVDNAEGYILNIKKVNADNTLSEVADYTNIRLAADTIDVDGLEQNTAYLVALASRSASFVTEDDTMHITTPEMPFTEDQVKNVKASAISAQSFEASWDVVEKAQQYAVTLAKHAYDGDDVATAYDFTDRANGLPDGWKTNSSNYMSSEGSFGVAAPSLRLAKDGNYLIVSNGDALINKVSFWYNTVTAAEGASLEIQTLTDGTWTTDKTMNLTEVKSENVSFDITPAKSVRIYFNRKGSANVLIDDVCVSGNSMKDTPLERYNNKNVGESLKCTFEDLEPATDYSLIVCGIMNGETTRPSKQLIVTTEEQTTGINTPSENNGNTEETFDIQGRKLNGAKTTTGLYIMKKGGKATKIANDKK